MKFKSLKKKYLLTAISTKKKDLKDLDAIRECVNLEVLDLSFNEINNLEPLKSLEKLQYLNLSCNQIKNLGKQKILYLSLSFEFLAIIY
jgi:Leucine-rich repeat (LRR) protein